MAKRILIGCPVRQKPAILAECLQSLSDLHQHELAVEFLFIDNNQIEESSSLLHAFSECIPNTTVLREVDDAVYACDDVTHHWSERLIWKVARFKDRIIEIALDREVDALFLIDSDLVVSPQLLCHLAKQNKDIVSEVFWTQWQPDIPMLPQVWLGDQYELFTRRRDEQLSESDVASRIQEFLNRIRRPGIYPVGGLGACTLISRGALLRGVRFAEIDNISLWGEDRHFSIRARALGVELWADTWYPPLHLYRDSDLLRVPAFRKRSNSNFFANPKLTLSMIVHNEANRWLTDALRAHRSFIDEAVIIDDGSTDDTVDVIRRELEGLPLRVVHNDTPRFSNEVELRKQQWEETVATNPDWLLILDADEILEPRATSIIPELIRRTDYAVFAFSLYDFWNTTHYRDDEWWCAHKSPRPFLVRYTPDFRYCWKETAQHCGRMPQNVVELPSAAVDLRVKHMGWASPSERARKHARYQSLDPEGRFGVKAQYDSILDSNPSLVAWQD